MPIAVRIFYSTGVIMAFCKWTCKLNFYSELQLIWISSILHSFAICHASRAWSLKRIRTLHSTSVVLGWQLQVSLSCSFLLFTSGAPFKNFFFFSIQKSFVSNESKGSFLCKETKFLPVQKQPWLFLLVHQIKLQTKTLAQRRLGAPLEQSV